MGAGAARRARVWLLSLRTLIVKALLFDFDGVLWDSEAAAFQSWQETYGEYGQHLPLDAFATRLGTVGGFDLVAQLELLVGRPIDLEAVAARRWDRKMQMVRQLQPRPGVLTYLHDAREHGLAVALVSTDDMEWITTGLQILDLLDAWDFIECAEGDQLRAKPSPALYIAALHRLGIRADEAVAIEDSPNGIRAAKAACVFCLGFANDVTRQLDLSRADVVVDSLDDLPLKDLLLLAAS
jgi:beta-phosphoglucomutase-like phosphatase (HAD superfamily)